MAPVVIFVENGTAVTDAMIRTLTDVSLAESVEGTGSTLDVHSLCHQQIADLCYNADMLAQNPVSHGPVRRGRKGKPRRW